MKNFLLVLALMFAGALSAVTPSPTTTPFGTLTPTPNATQTPHVVIPDSAAGQTFTAAAPSPLTMSYTVGSSGVSPAMVVHVLLTQPFGTDFVKSISYGGVSLGHLITNRYLGGGNITISAESWYILDPPTGANTLSIALSVTQPGTVGVAVSSYFNVWYIANTNASTSISNGSITQNQYAGFNGGTTTGVFAQFNAATLTTQVTGFTNRMLLYPSAYSLWMSIDDQRNYNPNGSAIPITWAYSGGTTTANALNYVELVPR